MAQPIQVIPGKAHPGRRMIEWKDWIEEASFRKNFPTAPNRQFGESFSGIAATRMVFPSQAIGPAGIIKDSFTTNVPLSTVKGFNNVRTDAPILGSVK